MIIRKINLKEVDLVVDLFNKYRIFYEQKSDITVAKNYLYDRLENSECVIFIAILAETPIAFTLLYPKFSSVSAKRNWHLGDLYVEKEHRKKGIGKQLIEQAINFAQIDKSSVLTLNTAEDNVKAQSLYENIGFKRKDGLAGFYGYEYLIE